MVFFSYFTLVLGRCVNSMNKKLWIFMLSLAGLFLALLLFALKNTPRGFLSLEVVIQRWLKSHAFKLVGCSFSGLSNKDQLSYFCRFACGILYQGLFSILVKLEKRCSNCSMLLGHPTDLCWSLNISLAAWRSLAV